jgi:hypothetical protein
MSCAAPVIPASGFLISWASISAMPMAISAADFDRMARSSRPASSRFSSSTRTWSGLSASGAICTSQDTGLRLPVPTSTALTKERRASRERVRTHPRAAHRRRSCPRPAARRATFSRRSERFRRPGSRRRIRSSASTISAGTGSDAQSDWVHVRSCGRLRRETGGDGAGRRRRTDGAGRFRRQDRAAQRRPGVPAPSMYQPRCLRATRRPRSRRRRTACPRNGRATIAQRRARGDRRSGRPPKAPPRSRPAPRAGPARRAPPSRHRRPRRQRLARRRSVVMSPLAITGIDTASLHRADRAQSARPL